MNGGDYRGQVKYAPGLAALSALSDSEVSSLAQALSSMPENVRLRQEIAEFVQGRLPDFRPGKIDGLVRALHSLYQARGVMETETSLDRFIDDLADAMTSSGIPSLALTDAERNRFVQNMHKLLDVDGLSFLAKAHALQTEHERLFHDAKILTDLRPVFHAPDEPPVDMILEYTLKIVFHDGSRRHREIFMAMDEGDIARLKKAIERAEKKAASLKALMNSKNLSPMPSLSEVR
jgi:hypothetical protein